MKLSRISLAPYRTRVERVRPINYSSSQISTIRKSPTSLVGSTRPLSESFLHLKSHENHVKPIENSSDSSNGNVSWPYRDARMNEVEQAKSEPIVKDTCACKKTCFILCSTIIGVYLLAATLAIILALKLPRTPSATVTTSTSTTSTTTTTTTTATTTLACNSTGRGTLLWVMNGPAVWTPIVHVFTATSTNSLLTFAQAGGNHDYYNLDSPSVVDMTSTSGELLNNNGFNDTTNSFQGWNLWCTNLCTGTTQGAAAVAILSSRIGSVGDCASLSCQNGDTNFFILGQYFPSVVGHVYKISFWYWDPPGGGGGVNNYLLVDVY